MINPMELTGRNIMVTGASSGIGRDTAILLSQLGARVFLVSRRENALEETLSYMDGADHVVLPYDLTDADSIPEWLKTVTQKHGILYGLVHSAGIQQPLPLRSLMLSALQTTMEINFVAGYALARGFRHKSVREDKAGSIVYVSSIAGLIAVPGSSSYSASKGALLAFARTLAVELARERIRVNCVAPGFVQTAMTLAASQQYTTEQFERIESMHPLGLGHSRDVAHAIAFLLADTGRWITGTTLIVDGGYTAQ